MTNQTMKLTVGGPVQVQAGTYLPRSADVQLLNACQAGTFAYVLACRQIGKSSLMIETSKKLTQAGVRTAQIDLNSIGQSADSESWYFSFVDELARRLKLGTEVQAWWETRPRLSTFSQRFLHFLREVVLVEILGNVVVFVDEIDMTLGLDFTDDFFAAIRSVYNDRTQYLAYQRLTFVLLGVAAPDELIKDQTRTPFNIGQAITLHDFTEEECGLFRLELESRYPEKGQGYFDQVYDWTKGHPYLTQKLCDAVIHQGVPGSKGGEPDLVDTLARKLFLAPESRGEDNIQFVQNRVTGDPHAQEMLRIYKRVLEGNKPVHDDEQSPAINRLKLYGLMVAQDGVLQVRNKLYAQAFDMSWAQERLRLASASVRLGLPPGRYHIVQEIGQGGFSIVYLAQIQDADKTQSVALKVLKADSIDDGNRLKRFKQEARAIAKLQHPNIIRILDTSDDEEPFYITMEYVAGGTLQDRLKSGALSRLEAMHIVRHIGAALGLAHERGIVHRDIKPANILLDVTQDPVRPVLTDFGLIKVLAGDDFSKIESAAILGTLDYMAPEQWRQEPLTPATDIYALAITFFEMLAGRRPFEGEASYYEMMNKHLEEPLPRLSGVAPEIGPFFDEVLLRAGAKKPSDRFESMADFIEAIEAANQQAEETERADQQDQAAKMIDVARGYMQRGRYAPEKALSVIDMALDTCPRYVDALRLKAEIRMGQQEFRTALDDYQRAYEQVGVPASEIGIEYLEALSQVAESLWSRQEYAEAIEYYERIWQILDGEAQEEVSIQTIWRQARERLVEYHHYVGDVAYAGGEPEDIDQVIQTLDHEIHTLDALEADHESQILGDKLRLLKAKKYEDTINEAQAAIDEIRAQKDLARCSNDEFFNHYLVLDDAYQNLIELDPEKIEWQDKRRKKLFEWAEGRRAFAFRALEKPECDSEAALRHLRAIQDIEETRYPGIAQELELDLTEKIAELEKTVDYDGKYNELMILIENGDHQRALERLDQEFIQTSSYEHRDVARWLWFLVYAKKYGGNTPPEWEGLSTFDSLSKRLVRMERARVQDLKDRLEPWSQARILETIAENTRTLGEYEEQVTGMETLISEAVTHGLAEKPEVEICRDDLGDLKTQIGGQRRVLFEMDMNEMAQRIDDWLQEIEEIEGLLETGNPLRDIPLFLERSDEAHRAIEADPTFEKLGALGSASVEIRRNIEKVEHRIQGRLWRVLVEDVGRRDEELTKLQKESIRLQDELTEAHQEATKRQTELADTQEEITALRQQEDSLERDSRKYRKQYELNRYIIPISLALALITGGLIKSLVGTFADSSVVMWIALVLLVVYFSYYAWVYYINRTGNE